MTRAITWVLLLALAGGIAYAAKRILSIDDGSGGGLAADASSGAGVNAPREPGVSRAPVDAASEPSASTLTPSGLEGGGAGELSNAGEIDGATPLPASFSTDSALGEPSSLVPSASSSGQSAGAVDLLSEAAEIIGNVGKSDVEPVVVELGGAIAIEELEEPEPNPLLNADPQAFVDAYERAAAAFDRGEKDAGIELFEQIYEAARDRADIGITRVVRRLAESATESAKTVEYSRYLVEHDPEFASDTGKALEVAGLLAQESNAPSLLAAWTLYTRAYEKGESDAQRARVLELLEPFIERHVFSGRHSPLLRYYRVKPGDRLDLIAAEFRTSADGIRRLNGLSSDTIRSGERLRVLPGTARVHVSKSEFRLALFIEERLLIERPIGTGADDSTPTGTFRVGERQKNPIWYRVGEPPLMPGDPRNILGTRWLGFTGDDRAAGIGIHGTRDDASVGLAESSGCIRMRNADVELLYDFVPRRTAVVVAP